MAPSTRSSRSSSGKSDLGWDRLWGRQVGFVPSTHSPKRKLRKSAFIRDAAFQAMLTDSRPPKTNSSKSRKSSSNSGNSLSPIIPDSGPLAAGASDSPGGAASDPPGGQMSEKRRGKQRASSSKGFLHDVKNKVKALKITKVPKEAPRSRIREPEIPDLRHVARHPKYVNVKPDGTFTISPLGRIATSKKLNKELLPVATSNHFEAIKETLDRTRVDLEKSQPGVVPFLGQNDLVGIATSRDLSKTVCQVIEEKQNADVVQAFLREGFGAIKRYDGEASELFLQMTAQHFMWLGVKIGMKMSEKHEKQDKKEE